jgi:hypothetical protein
MQTKEQRQAYYQKTKQARINQQRNKRNELRKWFREEIVANLKCIKCGENHEACMDFHHRDPEDKEFLIGEMLWKKFSKEKILKEIAKCDVLCSNCHRKHHWEDKTIFYP